MKSHTVFCQGFGGERTIWIECVEADDLESAMQVGKAACATDWGCDTDDVRVLGVAEGDVDILFWEDELHTHRLA